MKLLPFEVNSYTTNLHEIEVQTRLINVTKLKGAATGSDEEKKLYEGDIQGNAFRISRKGAGQHMFKTIVTGVIAPGSELTTVRTVTRINWLSFIFLLVWMMLSSLMMIVAWTGGQRTGSALKLQILFPLFAYGMMIIGFNRESERSKADLRYLFNAN